MTTQVTFTNQTIKIMRANDAPRKLASVMPASFDKKEGDLNDTTVLLVQCAIEGLTDVIAENIEEVQERI